MRAYLIWIVIITQTCPQGRRKRVGILLRSGNPSIPSMLTHHSSCYLAMLIASAACAHHIFVCISIKLSSDWSATIFFGTGIMQICYQSFKTFTQCNSWILFVLSVFWFLIRIVSEKLNWFFLDNYFFVKLNPFYKAGLLKSFIIYHFVHFHIYAVQ